MLVADEAVVKERKTLGQNAVDTQRSLGGAQLQPSGRAGGVARGLRDRKILMNNLAESAVQGTQLVLEPYQAVILELRKN
jgi:hypothetical protein